VGQNGHNTYLRIWWSWIQTLARTSKQSLTPDIGTKKILSQIEKFAFNDSLDKECFKKSFEKPNSSI